VTSDRLDLRPAPGPSPRARRVVAQARLELGMTLRNGEQLLLTVVIPLGLLVGLGLTDVVDLGTGPDRASRWAVLVPGVMALAMLSTAFTGLAIQTGFERRYGVLKRLGATPLGRSGLLSGKAGAVLLVEVGQLVVLGLVGAALGWRPTPGPAGAAAVVVLTLLGTWSLAALGLLLAGAVRAEATLALANLVYLVLLVGGGLFERTPRLPGVGGELMALLPTAALADGLRSAWAGDAVSAASWLTLVAWGALATAGVSRTFRWE
jgi:ABC-2 type transport system permease protein